jgi:Dirigent-like protein
VTRKLIVGVIAAALLLSGALVGVSYGGTGGITEPEVIELSLDLCSKTCRGFELQDPIFGRGTAWIVASDDLLFDVDGTRVGRQSFQCTVSGPWVCTYVITLKAGPYTEPGTVVTTGIYRFSDPPETLAVTGGTGAYENVRGYATMELVGAGADRHEVLTLNLIP